jgi:hypothetical protein
VTPQTDYYQIEIDGVRKSIGGWCFHYQVVSEPTARQRIRQGIDPAIAVSVKTLTAHHLAQAANRRLYK